MAESDWGWGGNDFESTPDQNVYSSGGGGGGGSAFARGGGGGGGGDSCFNCGQEGHRSRECPEPKKSREGGGNCYNCGQDGHQSRDCPEPRKPREGGGNCYNCGQDGHQSRDCPEPRKPREGGGNCYNCGQDGHQSRDCPEPRKPREGGGNCYNCGQEGHQSRDCPEPRKEGGGSRPPADENTVCNFCKANGHYVSDCPTAPPLYIHEAVEAEKLFETEKHDVGVRFNEFYQSAITVQKDGKDAAPRYMESFDMLDLTDQIKNNLDRMGYKRPTPIQKATSLYINLGEDVMACAQTGSGKTAAFLLPVMNRLIKDDNLSSSIDDVPSPRCIIVEPTRELAIQTFDSARMLSYQTIFTVCLAYGGASRRDQKMQMARGCTMLVTTMGRLLDFIEKGDISLDKVKYIVMDEADRMLDEGFGPEMTRLLEARGMPSKDDRQTAMFSATFPDEVQKQAKEYLKSNYTFISVDKVGSANKCVKQAFINCPRSEKKEELLKLLGTNATEMAVEKDAKVLKEKTLVFVSTKAMAVQLSTIIQEAGIPCTQIHADRSQQDRERALSDLKRGTYAVLVATGVAERGLDIHGIDHVINFDIPKTRDEYVHRIGRTGRVGYDGRATTLFDPTGNFEKALAPHLVEVLEEVGQDVPDFVKEAAEGGGGGIVGDSGFAGGSDPVAWTTDFSATGGGGDTAQASGGGGGASWDEDGW